MSDLAVRIDANRRKGLRRLCLQVLRQAQTPPYEGWLSPRAIAQAVALIEPGTPLADVAEALAYLAGRRLVEEQDRRLTRYDAPSPAYRITADGLDLLDGNILPVPGVEDDRP